MYRKLFTVSLIIVFSLGVWSHLTVYVRAQEAITATPARVIIPTQEPPQQIIPNVTATWTRTPTLPGPALLEAKDGAGDVNVRAEPDINSERIGSIRAGDTYVVLGKRFRWYQFQFDTSPNGRGWVFDELVEIIGDESAIRNLEVEDLPTVDPLISAATETQEAITLTPGGILTATAQAGLPPLPGLPGMPDQPGAVGIEAGEGSAFTEFSELPVVLPTFTYPPDVVGMSPTDVPEEALIEPIENPSNFPVEMPEDVPPIAPILALGGLGMLGLFISSLRR